MPTREEMIREMSRRRMIAELEARAAAPKAPEADVVNDSMPEWLDGNDRTLVKNLTNNDEEAMRVLRTKYPGAEFKQGNNGIIARRAGETSYGTLDPSFSPISNPLGTIKDLWNDTKDIGYDLLQGGAEAGGATVGAIIAAPTTPIGMLGAGAAGAGAGAGAASTLKQMLRKQYGISDDIDGSDIAMDAAIGAALPVAFHGAGKALSYGAKKVAPTLYSKATGLSVDALKEIAENGDDLAAMGDTEVHGLIKDAGGAVADNVRANKAAFADEYKALRGNGARISVDPIVQKLDEAIAAARQKRYESGSHFLGEEERALMAMKDRVFAAERDGAVAGTKRFTTSNGGPAVTTELPEGEMAFDSVRGAYRKAAEAPARGPVQYTDTGDFIPEHIKGDLDISHAMDMVQGLKNNFVDYADGIGGKVGTGNTVSAMEERAAQDLIEAFKQQIASGTDDASKALNDRYGQFVDSVDYLNRGFKSDAATERTLEAMRKGKSRVLKGNVKQLDPATQEKLTGVNRKLEINRYFNPPETGNIIQEGANTALGRSPLEKLLGAGGAAAGYVSGGPVMGVVGAATGRGIGALLTSPKSVLAITKAAKRMGITADELAARMRENPWLMKTVLGATYATAD